MYEKIVKTLINYPNEIANLPQEYYSNESIMLFAINQNYRNASLCSSELKENKAFAMVACSLNGTALKHFPDMANDYDVVMTAVKNTGFALRYASDRLKDTKDIVEAAIKNYGMAYYQASDRLRDDKELAYAAATNFEPVIEVFNQALKDDKEFMMKVALASEQAALNLPEKYYSDKDFMAQVCMGYGKAYEKCSEEVRSVPSIAIAAIRHNPEAALSLPASLHQNKDFILSAVSTNPKAYYFLSDPKILSDFDIVQTAVKKKPDIIYDIPQELKSDKKVMFALQKNLSLDFVDTIINNATNKEKSKPDAPKKKASELEL